MILRYSKCCGVGRRHWNLDAHCNLSRTLNTMAKYGIVDLIKDKRTVKPVVKATDFKVEFGVNTSFVQLNII